jgi:hypothetical protein
MIFLIFLGADLMNSALALTQVPAQLAGVVQGWGLPPLMVVAAIMLFYVVLGAVMDELSMILLTIPIFFPMIMGMDFGMPKESVAIWFGIMVLMTVGFGMLAPPVGLNVYVVNGLAKDVPIAESYKGVMPFLISDTMRTAAAAAVSGHQPVAGQVPELIPMTTGKPARRDAPAAVKLRTPRRFPTCRRLKMKRRSLIQGAAAATLGTPAGRAGPADRHAEVPHLHGADEQRVAQHAQAVDGEGREGLGRPHQVRGLPGDAAGRHAGAAVRPGARRRGRRGLDAARQHRRPLSRASRSSSCRS